MTWFKVDDAAHSHRKMVEAGLPAAGLWMLAGSWSAQHLTDGHVPAAMVSRLGATAKDARRLVAVGLWDTVADGYQFHDWEDYQPTRAEVLAQREKRSKAGRAGAESRWGDGTSDGTSHADGMASAMADRMADRIPVAQPPHAHCDAPVPVPVPVPKEQEQLQVQVQDPSSVAARRDIDDLCAHLADKIAANGSRRPNITSRWRTACRLLLDNDGRTEQQIRAAIDWSQNDEFWRAHILSMPKLREKYDQLRLAAAARTSAGTNPAEQRIAGHLALVDKYANQGEPRHALT